MSFNYKSQKCITVSLGYILMYYFIFFIFIRLCIEPLVYSNVYQILFVEHYLIKHKIFISYLPLFFAVVLIQEIHFFTFFTKYYCPCILVLCKGYKIYVRLMVADVQNEIRVNGFVLQICV